MTQDAPNPVLVETTRGPLVENRHRAVVAVCAGDGALHEAWGDVERPILPRSAVKILQALPMVESGAADAFGLASEQLALACASHQGQPMHSRVVRGWLHGLGLDESALLCGPQPPRDPVLRSARVKPSRLMNNCSGKHAGFLSLTLHAGADRGAYLYPEGDVQRMVAQAFAEITETEQPLAHGIDGCSAPNYAASPEGVARAMAKLAAPERLAGARRAAGQRLVEAMRRHPLLMSGEGRACAALIAACEGRAVVKTGADGVFTGILPEKGLGFCLKIEDGNTAAAEVLCAALLTRYGALEAGSPAAAEIVEGRIANFNDEIVGRRRALI